MAQVELRGVPQRWQEAWPTGSSVSQVRQASLMGSVYALWSTRSNWTTDRKPDLCA